jgi:hypothetical protein
MNLLRAVIRFINNEGQRFRVWFLGPQIIKEK